jgi:hypothetical protein
MTSWIRINIMCLSVTTCLPADCCFSELALWNPNSACTSKTKRTSSSSHWKLTCSCHDITEKLPSLRYTTITHSLTRAWLSLKRFTITWSPSLFRTGQRVVFLASNISPLYYNSKFRLCLMFICELNIVFLCFCFRFIKSETLSIIMTDCS